MHLAREKQKRRMSRKALVLSLGLGIALGSCSGLNKQQKKEPIASPELLKAYCQEIIGLPRVERISEHVWLAIGYDLASTVLIHTREGNIIVDPSMSPGRASQIKKAFEAHVPVGPVKAIVYTHSHIDHTGGASVWEEKDTQIWATDAFREHFFKQYGLFLPTETVRARRQFGAHLAPGDLPCGALGVRPDLTSAREGGVRLPTHTFSGIHALKIDNLTLELNEAHGETHDHLFIWIPEDKTLIGGDNFYWAFPNLYTIRGTSPRPVEEWVQSLDAMRRKEPEHLVPNHTRPIHGQKEIQEALTNYRDGIQWVRDEVVRRANRGEDLDTLAREIKLPPHLSSLPYLKEFYGQVDWSAKGIYTSHLGWFDGRPDQLYPPPARETAAREVNLMGGPEKVIALADAALKEEEARWAIHLLTKLRLSGLAKGNLDDLAAEKLARGYEKLAEGIYNTNGRAYLLESAYELRRGLQRPAPPKMDEKLVAKVPLEILFAQMAVRLIPEKAMDIHESVYFLFPDENKRFIVTVRRGVAEIVTQDPLPGTPDPIATMTVDSQTYRRIALNLESPLAAYVSGKIKVQGSWLSLLRFLGRFERAG